MYRIINKHINKIKFVIVTMHSIYREFIKLKQQTIRNKNRKGKIKTKTNASFSHLFS